MYYRGLSRAVAAGMATVALVGICSNVSRSGVSAAPVVVSSVHVVPAFTTSVPRQVWNTLARIDAGTWPPKDGSGTDGGRIWHDAEGRLPRIDRSGRRIAYREWDVDERVRGHDRDSRRIITGSDHSAWYTADHYGTFVRMR